MVTIEIDFEVFKELTLRRRSEQMTENDVIRELLGMPPLHRPAGTEADSPVPSPEGPAGDPGPAARAVLRRRPWHVQGVTFPHGTPFRAHHHGRIYEAVVEDGALVYRGTRFASPSAAARAVTGYETNGWIFWECRLPASPRWMRISELRHPRP